MAYEAGRCSICGHFNVSDPDQCDSIRCEKRRLTRDEILRLHRNQMKVKDIAHVLGVSSRTVGRVISAKYGARPYARPLTSEQLEQARAMLEDRAGYAETSRTLGIHGDTLARHFPGMGLRPDEYGEIGPLRKKMAHLK